MTVLITLTEIGIDAGPFDLYSNVDDYTDPFAESIDAIVLGGGYTSDAVPDLTTNIKVISTGTCTNSIDVPVVPAFQTTTTTTTLPPPCYTFVSDPYSERIAITYINCSGQLQQVLKFCTTGTCTEEICARLIIGSQINMTNTGPCIL
jgi:hypothetical protein